MNIQKKLCLSLICSASFLCSAETILTRTNEPEDMFIDNRIDLTGRNIRKEVFLNQKEMLMLETNKIYATVKKDSIKKLNKYNVIAPYDLFVDGKISSPKQILYIQCPVIKETYIDESTTSFIKNEDNTLIESISPKSRILTTDILDQGFYALSNSPKQRKPLLDEEAKESNIFINNICLNVQLAKAILHLHKGHNDIDLKEFEVTR